MQNDKIMFHTHIPCTQMEADAIRNYCKENGLILGQIVKRLILQEVKDKSTMLSPDFVPPSVKESLIQKKRT